MDIEVLIQRKSDLKALKEMIDILIYSNANIRLKISFSNTNQW